MLNNLDLGGRMPPHNDWLEDHGEPQTQPHQRHHHNTDTRPSPPAVDLAVRLGAPSRTIRLRRRRELALSELTTDFSHGSDKSRRGSDPLPIAQV